MLEILAFTWTDLLSPEFYIQNGGLWLMLFIVFAETGLFVGFFLPGDSLLFVAGIYSNDLATYLYDTGYDFSNLMMVVTLVAISGIVGNFVGYWFGAKSGPYLFERKDTMLYKKKYLFRQKNFMINMAEEPSSSPVFCP